MDDNTFQRFLYESEGDSLDFKQEQYKFEGETDEIKSELLKDIIAMANSWRRNDGYIILGVQDTPEKPNRLMGITTHIDDAKLQQFVNSKTNQLCKFEYKTYTQNGLTFGLLKIPVQKRPIFLKKDYGKLKRNIVYVKHGSSTAEALPDEVSQMGIAFEEEIKAPKIDISFYDHNEGISSGKSISVFSKHFEISDDIPLYESAYGYIAANPVTNSEYFIELYEYFDFKYAYIPISFLIENIGDIEATNIKIEIHINETDIDIKTDSDEKTLPEKSHLLLRNAYIPQVDNTGFYVERKNNKITAFTTMDMLHAKRKLDLTGKLYIKPLRSRVLNLDVQIYCDNIVGPFCYTLKVVFEYVNEEITWDNYKKKLKIRD